MYIELQSALSHTLLDTLIELDIYMYAVLLIFYFIWLCLCVDIVICVACVFTREKD